MLALSKISLEYVDMICKFHVKYKKPRKFFFCFVFYVELMLHGFQSFSKFQKVCFPEFQMFNQRDFTILRT